MLRKAGQAKVHVVLSAKGRRLLKSATRLTVTAKAKFTPSGTSAITTTKTCRLRR